MPMAARLGDPTSHAMTPLGPGPGSVDVMIGGLPAWRSVVDSHVCPLLTVLVPHVGGVILLGSPTVLINGFPAAGQGDLVAEVGPPNAIAMGAPTVTIGG